MPGPTNPKPLNPNQARFVAEYLKHGVAKAAAEAAGYKHGAESGYALMQMPAVKEAIDNARKEIVAEGTYNLKKAMKETDEGIQFAKDTENANALAKLIELRAKLNGLLIEKVAHTMVGFHVSVGGIDFSKRDGQAQLPEAQEPELEATDVTDSAEEFFE